MQVVVNPIGMRAGLINGWIATGIIAVGGLLALKLGAYIHTSISELFDQCRVPKYGGLSQSRQNELRQRGVSPEQWDHLKKTKDKIILK